MPSIIQNPLTTIIFPYLNSLPIGQATFLVILSAYLSFVMPCTLIDELQFFKPWKIQPTRSPPTKNEYKEAFRMVFLNFAWLLPVTFMATPILEQFLQQHVTNISIQEILFCFPFFWFFDDLCFYWYHRAFHHPLLYARFHKPHHVFTAPFAACSYAVHPVELMCQSLGGLLGPFILYPLLFRGEKVPVEIFWAYIFIRQWQGLEDHIGFDIKFSPTQLFGGTLHHDIRKFYTHNRILIIIILTRSHRSSKI
jgi:sterol desaturase/sphingolipid hydroxylase (fatty acid hydroxylase superfamily)